MSELSELLMEASEKRPMSARRRAERIEGRLHHATISAYLRGDHPISPDEATLQALADAFDLPLARVQAAAGAPVGAGPYVPPAEAARLTRRQQAALTEIIMAMVDTQGGQIHGVESPDQKSDDGAVTPIRRGRPLTPQQERFLAQAQPVEQAAYEGEGE